MYPNWTAPIGDESLLLAALRNAGRCDPVGPVFIATAPASKELCRQQSASFGAAATFLDFPAEPQASQPSSELDVFIRALREMKTEWLAALPPLQSNYFDPGAFEYARDAAEKKKARVVRCSAMKGWDLIGFHKSILPKLEEIAGNLRRIGYAPIDLHAALHTLRSEYHDCVDPYRAAIAARRGRALPLSKLNPAFLWCWPGTIDAYRSVTETQRCRLSELTIDRMADAADSPGVLRGANPFSAWLELSAVNDLPSIYSPLRHWSKPDRYPAYMDAGVFERFMSIVYEDISACAEIHLSGLGEPTQSPAYVDFLKSVQQAFRSRPLTPAIHCYTDGRLLDEETARLMTMGGVTSVMISLDAVEKGFYEKVRPGGDFDAVKSNVERLLEFKRTRPRPADWAGVEPVIALTTTLAAELEDHIDAFMSSRMYMNKWLKQHGKSLAPNAVWEVRDRFYAEGHTVEHLVIQGASTYAGQIPDRRLAVYTPLKRFPCRRLLNTLFVKTDGSIVVCDRIFDPTDGAVVANVRDIHSIRDVWGLLADKRNAHEDGRYAEAHARCQSCEDWFIPVD